MSATASTRAGQWTYEVKLPKSIPAHNSYEVVGYKVGPCLNLSLEEEKVVSDGAGSRGHHGGRKKLEKWDHFFVSWPRQQPAIIAGDQVPTVVHGPPS